MGLQRSLRLDSDAAYVRVLLFFVSIPISLFGSVSCTDQSVNEIEELKVAESSQPAQIVDDSVESEQEVRIKDLTGTYNSLYKNAGRDTRQVELEIAAAKFSTRSEVYWANVSMQWQEFATSRVAALENFLSDYGDDNREIIGRAVCSDVDAMYKVHEKIYWRISLTFGVAIQSIGQASSTENIVVEAPSLMPLDSIAIEYCASSAKDYNLTYSQIIQKDVFVSEYRSVLNELAFVSSVADIDIGRMERELPEIYKKYIADLLLIKGFDSLSAAEYAESINDTLVVSQSIRGFEVEGSRVIASRLNSNGYSNSIDDELYMRKTAQLNNLLTMLRGEIDHSILDGIAPNPDAFETELLSADLNMFTTENVVDEHNVFYSDDVYVKTLKILQEAREYYGIIGSETYKIIPSVKKLKVLPRNSCLEEMPSTFDVGGYITTNGVLYKNGDLQIRIVASISDKNRRTVVVKSNADAFDGEYELVDTKKINYEDSQITVSTFAVKNLTICPNQVLTLACEISVVSQECTISSNECNKKSCDGSVDLREGRAWSNLPEAMYFTSKALAEAGYKWTYAPYNALRYSRDTDVVSCEISTNVLIGQFYYYTSTCRRDDSIASLNADARDLGLLEMHYGGGLYLSDSSLNFNINLFSDPPTVKRDTIINNIYLMKNGGSRRDSQNRSNESEDRMFSYFLEELCEVGSDEIGFSNGDTVDPGNVCVLLCELRFNWLKQC